MTNGRDEYEVADALYGAPPQAPTPAPIPTPEPPAAAQAQAQATNQPDPASAQEPAPEAQPAPFPDAPAAVPQSVSATDLNAMVPAAAELDAATPAPAPRSGGDVYARRRAGAFFLVIIAIVGGVWFFGQSGGSSVKGLLDSIPGAPGSSGPTLPGAQPADPQAATPADPQAAASTGDVLKNDLDAAVNFRSSRGTFVGFSPSAGVGVAAGRDVVVLTSGSGANCFFTGVAPGFDGSVKSDPSGANCEPSALAEIQDEISTNDANIVEAGTEAAVTRLEGAAQVLQFAAANNFVGGSPSFNDLAGVSMPDGVTLLGVTGGGSQATIQTEVTPNRCLAADVTVDSFSTYDRSC